MLFTTIQKQKLKLIFQIKPLLSYQLEQQESFEINSYKKDNMLNGFDDIDYLQNIKEEIETFANDLLL